MGRCASAMFLRADGGSVSISCEGSTLHSFSHAFSSATAAPKSAGWRRAGREKKWNFTFPFPHFFFRSFPPTLHSFSHAPVPAPRAGSRKKQLYIRADAFFRAACLKMRNAPGLNFFSGRPENEKGV